MAFRSRVSWTCRASWMQELACLGDSRGITLPSSSRITGSVSSPASLRIIFLTVRVPALFCNRSSRLICNTLPSWVSLEISGMELPRSQLDTAW